MAKMYRGTPYDVYRANEVQTQTQGKLIVMMYDGAIKFIERAQQAISDRNIPDAHENILKAQNIIKELIVTLNMDAGPIAKQLFDLYEFMYYHLIQANLKKDKKMLEDVRGLLADLRESWAQIA